jgi:hypothetical protein
MEMMRRASPRGVQTSTTSTKVPRGDDAVLAIGTALILDGDGAALEHHSRVGEIQSPVLQGIGSLGWIESDVRRINVSRNSVGRQFVMQKSSPFQRASACGASDSLWFCAGFRQFARHPVVAFDLLVAVKSDVVTSLFRGRRGAIAVDDGHIEQSGLMESRDHVRENDIEQPSACHRRKAP